LNNTTRVQTLRRVDPSTGRVLATRVGTRVQSAAASQAGYVIAGRLWVLAGKPTRLALDGLDRRTLATRTVITLDRSCRTAATFGGTNAATATLYLDCDPNTVFAVDLATRRVVRRFSVPGASVQTVLTPGGDRMYAVTDDGHDRSSLYVLDPRTGRPVGPTRHYSAGNGIGLEAASNGGVWITTGSGMEYSATFHPADDLDHTTNATGTAGGGYLVTVSVYPHIAWLGSTTNILCADPDTGAVRAAATVPAVRHDAANIADFTLAGTRLFADFRHQPHDQLITLTQPPRCTR
jgi:outer membrane protein assembly factor BamB